MMYCYLVLQMSMEQRLGAISLDKSDTTAKQAPQADTLIVSLVQGLQSKDQKILTVCQLCNSTN